MTEKEKHGASSDVLIALMDGKTRQNVPVSRKSKTVGLEKKKRKNKLGNRKDAQTSSGTISAKRGHATPSDCPTLG